MTGSLPSPEPSPEPGPEPSPAPSPAQGVEGQPRHGGQLDAIARRFGLDRSRLVDFSASINPSGPPPGVAAVLRRALDEPSTLGCYPDLEETALRRGVASYAGVEAENVAVGNGFVALLDAALGALSIRHCRLPVPAFVEYRRRLEQAAVAVTPVPLDPESGFAWDPRSLAAGPEKAILLANPQNPTGRIHSRESLLELTERAAESGGWILLDEAFIDYCPGASLAAEVERHPNLLVFRSLTKFFAMPGLRVAYAVAARDTIRRIQERVSPWPITSLASLAALAAVADGEYIRETRETNERRRARLEAGLRELSLRPEPSAANFLLLRLPAGVDAGLLWRRMIGEAGIVLRLCRDYEALGDGYLRAAVRTEADNKRLIGSLAGRLAASRAAGGGGPRSETNI